MASSRTEQRKKKIIEQLRKRVIVQAACMASGVSSTTYYRWCEEDDQFRDAANKAIEQGEKLVTEAALGVIITKIKNNDFRAAKYWLEHHRKPYMKEPTNMEDENPLTPEKRAQIQDLARKWERRVLKNRGMVKNDDGAEN